MVYTADDIKIISWPEPVRSRPEMYFRTLGVEGCIKLIESVLESILDEKYKSNAKQVEIRLNRHKEIVIEYDGLGMPISFSNDDIPQPHLYRTLMSLSGGEFSDKEYSKYGHLVKVGPMFNAACRELRLTTFWNRKAFSLSFYKGCLSSLLSESHETNFLNCLRFTFDKDVMGNIDISDLELKKLAKSMQEQYPNSKIWFGS